MWTVPPLKPPPFTRKVEVVSRAAKQKAGAGGIGSTAAKDARLEKCRGGGRFPEEGSHASQAFVSPAHRLTAEREEGKTERSCNSIHHTGCCSESANHRAQGSLPKAPAARMDLMCIELHGVQGEGSGEGRMDNLQFTKWAVSHDEFFWGLRGVLSLVLKFGVRDPLLWGPGPLLWGPGPLRCRVGSGLGVPHFMNYKLSTVGVPHTPSYIHP